MNKPITALTVLTSTLLLSQISSKINNAQNVPVSVANPPFLIGADPVPEGTWRKYIKSDVKWETSNINGLAPFIETTGSQLWLTNSRTLTINGVSFDLSANRSWSVGDVLTTNSYSNPSWLTDLSYSKITGVPTIPTNTNQLINGAGFITTVPPQTWSSITGKPDFSIVSTTGSYNDLINKPTIPAGQVNSDWNASTGVSQILNKPAIYNFSGLGTQYTKGDGTYATFPTTLSSFTNDTGFVNSTSLNTSLSNYTTSSNLAAALATKENTIAPGTTSQYWRGDKTWSNLNSTAVPEGTNLYYTDARARASHSAGAGISYNSTTGVITNSAPNQVVTITGSGVTGTYPNFTIAGSGKRQITATGTTDASGNFTLTFSPPFATPPNIQTSIANQGANTSQFVKVVSTTVNSTTINVFQRSAIMIASSEVLVANTTNVAGAVVDILVTDKN